jgi:tetratricopeptide (TPR) repeat protein
VKRHHYDEAESALRRSLAVSERVQGPDHPNTAVAARNLGGFYAMRKRYAEAEFYYREAVPILEKTWTSGNPQLLSLLNDFVAILRINHHYADAERWEVRATNVRFRSALRER